MAENVDKIRLGSGTLYCTEFTGDVIPDNATICTENNRLGRIQGGATLEYKPSFYEVKDDLGFISKTILTEEEVTLKSGVLTWNGKTLGKLCSTARVTEDKSKKLRTVKIGGIGNIDGKRYVICFHHQDKIDGDIWVTIVGKNQNGFSMAFVKDKETVIDAEFKALPGDKQGTLVTFVEEMEKS
ncbi:hypothetical protein [Peptostreptococcus sp. D1]|uniref:hypothetical protein n=1 Tax=Peptostreptococcus sp. D1 TaxID=72304 RepID=UPI0008E90C0D|nr:hypothetical protein [Peptostreptococcus sp. D1]SFE84015.1 hypothetical protein SAMN02910278_01840 [Peptostreptococcus sp. D1]